MDILLTNDDGIQAYGLRCLYRALCAAGHTVTVVAPLTQQSAVGHAVTLSMPLRVEPVQEDGFSGYGISGTPVDAVKMALSTLLPSPPEVIVSGINAGANVGVDILYSGTVSAATEGALAGFPALAVSIDHFHPWELQEQAAWAARFVTQTAWQSLPQRRVLNLNFPACPLDKSKGVRVCPQTQTVYQDEYVRRLDPRGGEYFWLTGQIPLDEVQSGSDRALLSQDYVTVTPLCFDFTDTALLGQTQALFEGLPLSS
ncbi:MAG: 5'/3'-nucleotidase SurE [Thermodesulfobacteriota bacterium]